MTSHMQSSMHYRETHGMRFMGQQKHILDTLDQIENCTLALDRFRSHPRAAELLAGGGPSRQRTLFCPTDEAFEARAREMGVTVDDLLRDDVDVLYHIHDGRFRSQDWWKQNMHLRGGHHIPTVAGEDLSITTDTKLNVRFGDAICIATDKVCTNGLIHFVDRVILPPSRYGGQDIQRSEGGAGVQLEDDSGVIQLIISRQTSGQVFTIEVGPDDTVQQIKEAIFANVLGNQYNPWESRILFSGRELQEHKTVKLLGLQNGDVLNIPH
mmetsp:Transcript_27434/g.66155  ORF Transcript_27434/g.66155 Transcript_27434/m.66155 type:complete len:268 (+) Transcript_27434:53-856(+)